MKFLFKTTPFLLMALMAFGMTACHNGSKEPESDQKKKLDHLIFEEICYIGSEKTYDDGKSWQKYKADQYVKITNPTSESVYLDGMGLAISALKASSQVTLREGTDCRETHFGAGTLLRFPGKSGEKTQELKPGKSIYIASMAHNHTVKPSEDSDFYMYNEDSYDLSTVDYQWMSEDEVIDAEEFEYNPKVPSLRLVEPYERSTPSIFAANGYAIAIVKFPDGMTDDDIWDKYLWETSYSTNNTGSYGHGGKTEEYLKFPNEIVEDAVLVCTHDSYAWSIIPGLDAGYASTEELETAEYVCKALHRKFDGIKFVDDNNSTTDFEVKAASKWLTNHEDPTKAN